MRLIDADIIDDYLGDQADEWYESEEGPGDDFMDGYCWVLNRLQDKKRFPTVEAIPIEWIENILADMGHDSPYRPAIKWLLITYRMERKEREFL